MNKLTPYEQSNPRAHANAPYALRYGANRPEGSYATLDDAAQDAKSDASIVTVDGWWIVARVVPSSS